MSDLSIKKHACEMCSKSFQIKRDLFSHLRRHIGEKAHKCKQCGKSFLTITELKRHAEVIHLEEHGLKKYFCLFCKFSSRATNSLQRHLRVHICEKPFPCDICHNEFSEIGNLKKHIKIVHRREKNQKCEICATKFAQKSDLNRHMRTHTNERPFKCTVCQKSFKQNSYLSVHMKIVHMKEKLHKCQICAKQFSRKGHLNYHIIQHHTIERYNSCNICKLRFVTATELLYHQRRKHTYERPFKCGQCGKSFVTASELKIHQFVHTDHKPAVCQVCRKPYKYVKNLHQHIQICHPEATGAQNIKSCVFCNESLCARITSYEAHLRKHTGEKPFICLTCGREYVSYHGLHWHNKKQC